MLSFIDIGAVILLVLFTSHGSQRGIVRTILDIFAVLLAIFAAAEAYKVLSTTVFPFLKATENISYVLTFSIVWIAVYLALDILISALQKVVKVTFLGIVEKFGGGLLGFLKGVLIVGMIIQLFNILPMSSSVIGNIRGSMSAKLTLPTLQQTYSKAFSFFPQIDFFVRKYVIPAVPSPEAPGKTK